MYVCVATLVLTFPGTWILIGLNKKTNCWQAEEFLVEFEKVTLVETKINRIYFSKGNDIIAVLRT